MKTFELCESRTGYLWCFLVYTYIGKNTVLQSSLITPDTPKTAAAVLELLEPLFGHGHTLWMDNFFNNTELENIPAIKDGSGQIITDPTEKANSLNFYYSTIFSREECIPQIQEVNKNNPCTIDIKTIRRRIRTIGKNKSVGPDRVPGELLKIGGKP